VAKIARVYAKSTEQYITVTVLYREKTYEKEMLVDVDEKRYREGRR